MKKILFIVLCVAGITMYSCTKEELVIIDEELVLEENSPEFQTYLAERAMGFIRMYRFEKLGNVLDKIEDTALKTNLLDCLRKYKTEAENGGLFFVTPQNDSLFFMVPHAQSPAERTSLGMLFNTSPNIINAKGVLQGFKNFPKVQYFSGTNSLATGLKDLEYMPDMKEFGWIFYPADFTQLYPEGELPVTLAADFSASRTAAIFLPVGSTIPNAPDWLSQYVYMGPL